MKKKYDFEFLIVSAFEVLALGFAMALGWHGCAMLLEAIFG